MNEVIQANPRWYRDFLEYHRNLDSIFNLAFYVADETERSALKQGISEKCFHLTEGLNQRDILNLLAPELEGNKRSSIRNFTAQFVSVDSEVKQHQLVYRELSFLDR